MPTTTPPQVRSIEELRDALHRELDSLIEQAQMEGGDDPILDADRYATVAHAIRDVTQSILNLDQVAKANTPAQPTGAIAPGVAKITLEEVWNALQEQQYSTMAADAIVEIVSSTRLFRGEAL